MKNIVFLKILMMLMVHQVKDTWGQSIRVDSKGSSNDKEPFIPTKEWQIVKEDQHVPPGLHVRFNMQTGLVEAKLLDKDADKDKEGIPMMVKRGEKITTGVTKKGVTMTPQDVVTTQTKTQLTREQIMEALYKVKDGDDVKDEKVAAEAKKKKFRSYEELKKDFDKMNVHVKMDIEVIKELMAKLNNTHSTTAERKSALTDLEYYLHQIDNAIDFMKIDGLNLLLHVMDNKELELRSEATFAIGSAVQSNVKVQIRALELGLLQNLKLKILMEKDAALLNRVLFSLSTLLRNFPFAQLKFVRNGGLEAMKQLFVDGTRSQPRLQVRMVTLLYDLVYEHTTHEKYLNKSDPMQVEKLRQYKQINIVRHIVNSGWCKLTEKLLSLPDHDSREKVLISLSTFHEFCPTSSKVKQKHLVQVLERLASEYRELADEEVKEGEKDGYFKSMRDRIVSLIKKTKTVKDEL